MQTKLVQVEQTLHAQSAQSERQQQKVRELELELARNSTNRNATTSLQEDLQAERAQLISADKKVSAGVSNPCPVVPGLLYGGYFIIQ